MSEEMHKVVAFVELCQVRTRAWGVLKTGYEMPKRPGCRVKWLRRYESYGTLHAKVVRPGGGEYDILCPQMDYTIG